MANKFKTFEPKADVEGLQVTSALVRESGASAGKPFVVSSWPYKAKSQAEEELLSNIDGLKVKTSEREGQGQGGGS